MLVHQGRHYCAQCFAELAPDEAICPSCGHDDDHPGDRLAAALPAGAVLLGKYVIGRVLGKGGFGVTYLAFDLAANCQVAIKEYLPDTLSHRNTGETAVSAYAGEKEAAFRGGAEKFYDEARTLARFSGHPNIIHVREFFYENNTAYFAMEYVSGCDLRQHVAALGGRLSEVQCLAILEPLLNALIVLHSVGVLHRDISPDNIFITDDGDVKLLDFGSARQVLGEQSKSLSVVLKPGFAPIEQYQTRGKQGPWTDIYAAAATIYWCLTGQIPLPALDRLEEERLQPPSQLGCVLSRSFEAALLKSLAVRAVARYQTVADFKAAIDFSAAHAPAALPEEKAAGGELTGHRQGKRRLVLLAAVLVVLLGVVAVSAWQMLENDPPAGPRPSDTASPTQPSGITGTAETTSTASAETTIGSESAVITPSATAGNTSRPTTATSAAPTGTARPTSAASTAAQLSVNCSLASLTISGYDFSPCVSEGETTFYFTVGSGDTRLSVQAVPADAGASVTLAGDGIDSDLLTGDNTMTITVTAPAGTSKVYTFFVTREPTATSGANVYSNPSPANDTSLATYLSVVRIEYESAGSLRMTYRIFNNTDASITDVELRKLVLAGYGIDVIASFEGSEAVAESIPAHSYVDSSHLFSGVELVLADAWLPNAYIKSSSTRYSG